MFGGYGSWHSVGWLIMVPLLLCGYFIVYTIVGCLLLGTAQIIQNWRVRQCAQGHHVPGVRRRSFHERFVEPSSHDVVERTYTMRLCTHCQKPLTDTWKLTNEGRTRRNDF